MMINAIGTTTQWLLRVLKNGGGGLKIRENIMVVQINMIPCE